MDVGEIMYYSKIVQILRKKAYTKTVLGSLLFIAYSVFSHPFTYIVFTAVYTYLFSLYSQFPVIARILLFVVYIIFLLLFYLIHNYKKDKIKETNFKTSEIAMLSGGNSLLADSLQEWSITKQNLLEEQIRFYMESIHTVMNQKYETGSYRITVVMNYKDKNGGAYCKLKYHPIVDKNPYRHDLAYYHGEVLKHPDEYPFFARLMAGHNESKEFIGKNHVIYLSDRGLIESLFEDKDHRNKTEQYLGILIYDNHHYLHNKGRVNLPIALIQISINEKKGFGKKEDALMIINNLLIPLVQGFRLAYSIYNVLLEGETNDIGHK